MTTAPPTADQMSCAERVILVVVHDVTPQFLAELNVVTSGLEPLVGKRKSAAVVPRWNAAPCERATGAYRQLLDHFAEHLLHGWTHQSAHRWRPLSLVTGRADEFCRLEEPAILSRVRQAQADFYEVTGRRAIGFLPPAWQFPLAVQRVPSLQFILRFRRLESCHRSATRALATWSWDWGRIGFLGSPGAWLGTLFHYFDHSAVPCIAIHPIDVRRGYFARALRLVELFRHHGFRPVTCCELLQIPEESP